VVNQEGNEIQSVGCYRRAGGFGPTHDTSPEKFVSKLKEELS